MSADLNTEIEFLGTAEELTAFVDVLRRFEGEYAEQYRKKRDCAYISSVRIQEPESSCYLSLLTEEKLAEIIAHSDQKLCVSASGPWGVFENLVDSGLFQELAKAASQAQFKGKTEGFTTGESTSLQAELADGKLHLKLERLADDWYDMDLAEALELLPLDTFLTLFHVDPEECDEFLYEEYMESALYDEDFPDVDYAAFLDLFPIVRIDEEEYPQAIEAVKKTGIGGTPEGMIDEMTYDPVTEEYGDFRSNYSFEEEENAYESCEGKTFVITGKLEYFDNRDEMTEYIEDDGGRVTDGVSSKTDFLICNDPASASSKMKKAKELGIPILTEEEFLRRFSDDPEVFGIEIE